MDGMTINHIVSIDHGLYMENHPKNHVCFRLLKDHMLPRSHQFPPSKIEGSDPVFEYKSFGPW